MIECVFLDLGKVLLDFDYTLFGNRMQELTGIGLEPLRAAFEDRDLAVKYESGRMSDREFHRVVCERIGENVAFEDFVSAWNSIFRPVPLLPETLLSSLSIRVRLWAISNTNGLHFRHLITSFPVLRLFHGFTLSHRAGALKPDSRIFMLALKEAGTSATESLFVDDQAVNVEAARSLGFDSFRFQGVEHFAAELDKRALIE